MECTLEIQQQLLSDHSSLVFILCQCRQDTGLILQCVSEIVLECDLWRKAWSTVSNCLRRFYEKCIVLFVCFLKPICPELLWFILSTVLTLYAASRTRHYGSFFVFTGARFCFFKLTPAPSITQGASTLTLLYLLLSAEKPMAQGPPGGVIGILGGVVAIGLIIGVAVTVFMVHRRQQKTRTETDNDLWVPRLCHRILQRAGQVVRLGAHSCQPMREKTTLKRIKHFFVCVCVLMCSEAEEHTANKRLPPLSPWEPIIIFPMSQFIKKISNCSQKSESRFILFNTADWVKWLSLKQHLLSLCLIVMLAIVSPFPIIV